MPVLSCFTGFGFLRFSSQPSEHEKVYRALLAAYRDPRTGHATLDLSVGTHKEAQIYGWSAAIAAARLALKQAGEELRAETAYYELEAQERKFGTTPGPDDTVVMRRAALAARQKAARGPRHEALWTSLRAVFGASLLEIRPVRQAEAEVFPANLAGPALLRRPDAVAKSVRLLTAVARTNPALVDSLVVDSYVGNQDGLVDLYAGAVVGAAQTFRPARGGALYVSRWILSTSGAPTGPVRVKLYSRAGSFGTTSRPAQLLAASDAVDASLVAPGVNAFVFSGQERVFLDPAHEYAAALEYAGGDAGNKVSAVTSSSLGHAGNASTKTGSAWSPAPAYDLAFSVRTSGLLAEVTYEQWNARGEILPVVKGDVLCVDPGLWGSAERVYVEAASTGSAPTLTAAFSRPHEAGTYATTGPVPLWASTKRHILVVVKAAASVDPELVRRADAVLRSVLRAPTTWAIVQPTSPGAGTAGPFKVGATAGSPLGAVPLESLPL